MCCHGQGQSFLAVDVLYPIEVVVVEDGADSSGVIFEELDQGKLEHQRCISYLYKFYYIELFNSYITLISCMTCGCLLHVL